MRCDGLRNRYKPAANDFARNCTVTRFKWPLPSDEYIHQDLSEGEGAATQMRKERFRFLWQEFGPPANMMLMGGLPALLALHELKASYLYGNFMATVLLAQVYVEVTLAGSYVLSEKEDLVNSSFATLIDAASDDDLISPNIATAFHRLRRMRNPYTHYTMGLGERSYMGRLLSSNCTDPEELAVEDAKFAIRTVVDFLRYSSPNWNPEKVHWNEDDAPTG